MTFISTLPGTLLLLASVSIGQAGVICNETEVPGLEATVIIQLDGQAVPTIEGKDPHDVHAGLGWMHGRERFFQMDVARRSAAGELAALAGPPMVRLDRDNAMSRRREVAEGIVASPSAPAMACVL